MRILGVKIGRTIGRVNGLAGLDNARDARAVTADGGRNSPSRATCAERDARADCDIVA